MKLLGRSSDWTLKEKAFFTITVLLVYRLGVAIPLPYVDGVLFKMMVEQSAAGNLFTMMSFMGGALMSLGLLSLGVMPYITASILMQLFKVVMPKLEEMYKSDEGQKKASQITRYLTIPLAVLQSVGIVVGAPALFGFQVFTDTSILAKVVAVFAMTVGALISMRLGEEITIRGLGNGASLLIFTSILVTLPGLFTQAWTSHTWVGILGFAVIILSILAVVTFVEKSEYRIPVIYTKSSQSSRVQSSKLPVKVALAGVLPVIFAGSMVSLPMILSQVYPKEWVMTLASWFTQGSWIYTLVFIGLTVGFTFFSIMLVFDAKKLSNEIRVQGGFINSLKPGEQTEEYLSYVANKMGILGAIYLSVITLVTIYLFPLVGLTENALGATSVIILSSVIATLVSVVDAERSNSNLTGFFNQGSSKSDSRKKLFKGFKPRKSKVGSSREGDKVKGFLS